MSGRIILFIVFLVILTTCQQTVPLNNAEGLNITPPPAPQHQQQPRQKILDETQVGIHQTVGSHTEQVIQPLFQSTKNQRIHHEQQPEPAKTIEGTVNGQEVQYEKTQADRVLELQNYHVDAIDINYEHIKTYSFEVQDKANFLIKVNDDVEIKGIFNVYWIDNDAYSESTYKLGEEVFLTIYQDQTVLLYSQSCYHNLGFRFLARKGHTYSLNFATRGTRKLISMITENYFSQRKGQDKLNREHTTQQQRTTETIKNTLKMYLSVVERNYMMNQQIAYNVTLHSKRYMSYQIIEMIFMIIGACIQVYLVKRLLNTSSIV